MGKTDDMQRLRAEQHAAREERAAKAAKAAKIEPRAEPAPAAPPPPAAAPARAPQAKGAADADEGKCSVCNKVKPLKNGVLAQHQKGFGKACPGSRQAPV